MQLKSDNQWASLKGQGNKMHTKKKEKKQKSPGKNKRQKKKKTKHKKQLHGLMAGLEIQVWCGNGVF